MRVVALVLACLAIGACSFSSTTVQKDTPTRTVVADPSPAQATTTTTSIGVSRN